MASYDEGSLKEGTYHSHPQLVPQYPPPPETNSQASVSFNDQLYPNTDPALQPAPQPVAIHPAPPPQQHASTPKAHKPQGQGENGETREVKNRLRKACDSCSIRKVKCDEDSPCKACVTLEIPCTFDRPSKRRGPPNRHADAIKKQRTGSPGHTGHAEHPQPGSPTHAAHTLASFSQQQVLTIETIMPWPVLSALVDDYFAFIHPLVPVPHEPSFRQALQRREDLENRTFLALTASMLGCLLASFPRRARQHLRNLKYDEYFPNSISMVDRCRKVAVEAQGSASFQRKNTIHDAIINYLQGMTSAYIFDQDSSLLYFSQCLAICTTLGLYRSTSTKPAVDGARIPRMTANGQGLQGPQAYGDEDLILQELGRRTFWTLYVSVKSLQQPRIFPFTLFIAPASKTYPHPPLSLEVDDQYLTPQQVFPQPPGVTMQLAGFNLNARMFSFHEQISTNELVHGVDEVFDWERQKAELEACLQNVKHLLEQLPSKFQLAPQRSSSSPTSVHYPPLENRRNSVQHQASNVFSQEGSNDRATIQLQIQKANIHVNQLSIRSYLVEKYWTLRARRNASSASAANDSQQQPSLASTSASALTEAAMTAERLEITQDFLRLVSNLSQVAVEPNGLSIIPKLRAIASTLLGTSMTTPSTDPNANGDRRKKTPATTDDGKEGGHATQEEHLESFLNALLILESVLPANEHPEELDEEAQLRAWADLWVVQERYVATRIKGEQVPETSGR